MTNSDAPDEDLEIVAKLRNSNALDVLLETRATEKVDLAIRRYWKIAAAVVIIAGYFGYSFEAELSSAEDRLKEVERQAADARTAANNDRARAQSALLEAYSELLDTKATIVNEQREIRAEVESNLANTEEVAAKADNTLTEANEAKKVATTSASTSKKNERDVKKLLREAKNARDDATKAVQNAEATRAIFNRFLAGFTTQVWLKKNQCQEGRIPVRMGDDEWEAWRFAVVSPCGLKGRALALKVTSCKESECPVTLCPQNDAMRCDGGHHQLGADWRQVGFSTDPRQVSNPMYEKMSNLPFEYRVVLYYQSVLAEDLIGLEIRPAVDH